MVVLHFFQDIVGIGCDHTHRKLLWHIIRIIPHSTPYPSALPLYHISQIIYIFACQLLPFSTSSAISGTSTSHTSNLCRYLSVHPLSTFSASNPLSFRKTCQEPDVLIVPFKVRNSKQLGPQSTFYQHPYQFLTHCNGLIMNNLGERSLS